MQLERVVRVDAARKSDEGGCGSNEHQGFGWSSKERRGWVRLETSDGDEGGWRLNERQGRVQLERAMRVDGAQESDEGGRGSNEQRRGGWTALKGARRVDAARTSEEGGCSSKE